jgi:hypothetical protein
VISKFAKYKEEEICDKSGTSPELASIVPANQNKEVPNPLMSYLLHFGNNGTLFWTACNGVTLYIIGSVEVYLYSRSNLITFLLLKILI